MNITFACPKCEAHDRTEIQPGDAAFACRHCGQKIAIPPATLDDGAVTRCLACPSTDLFVRKDFPQRLGVALVAVGIIGSSIAWAYGAVIWTFAILFASALADVALYAIVPDALMCYRCGAMYRGAKNMDRHGAFDLETHERYPAANRAVGGKTNMIRLGRGMTCEPAGLLEIGSRHAATRHKSTS